MVEAGLVEALDALGYKQIAVGDHAGHAAVVANAGDDRVEVGVEERLAAGDGDDGGAEAGEVVDAADHLIEGDGFGDVVVLIAISAGEIAPAHGHNLGHDGVARGGQCVRDEGDFAHFARGGFEAAANRHFAGRRHVFSIVAGGGKGVASSQSCLGRYFRLPSGQGRRGDLSRNGS